MENEYYLDNYILNEIKNFFLKRNEEESCGLIVCSNGVNKFIPCQNSAQDKKNNFLINPLDYINAKSQGNIIYCCHSHFKRGSFSNEDITNSFKNKINYLLYNIKQDKFYFFNIEKYSKYRKYINLKFELGKNDCGNLIYNFYKEELKIEAPIKPIFSVNSYEELKKSNLHIWDKKIYYRNLELFYILENKEFENLQEYDIMIFNDKNNIPIHGAMYIGQDLILHQMYESPSRIESLKKGYLKYVSDIFRYKNYDTI